MADNLQLLLSLTLVIFMAGSLLEMGLKIRLNETLQALKDRRLLGLSILWAFVLCPALALSFTKIIPMAEPYAVGLLLLGMAPIDFFHRCASCRRNCCAIHRDFLR